jgi:predicted nuclease of predicted toxin-antitoxin system
LEELRNGGHSATHALDVFPPGTADEKLFAHAQSEQAAFLTTDRDFFHTIPLAFVQHSGAIVITLRRPNRADLLRRLMEALTVLGERNLDNAVWLVTDTRIYSRQKT